MLHRCHQDQAQGYLRPHPLLDPLAVVALQRISLGLRLDLDLVRPRQLVTRLHQHPPQRKDFSSNLLLLVPLRRRQYLGNQWRSLRQMQ
jgi:hypothetical protein